MADLLTSRPLVRIAVTLAMAAVAVAAAPPADTGAQALLA
ncbi:hypothetical protein QE361_003026 [Sphingomonas sp. SORGH_AS802]|nr:hypothetical protein [Sphingomonas sp. SORGH_AS_0438]MDR6136027.1 hypothetical protein [Sphingomonas sp. SORGH_AS_0802]